MGQFTAPSTRPPAQPDRGIQWFRAFDHDADGPAEWQYEEDQAGKKKTPFTDKAVQLIAEMPGGKLVPRKDPPWTDKLYYPAAERDEDDEFSGSPKAVPRNDMPCRWNQRALRWEVVSMSSASPKTFARITDTDSDRETGCYSWKVWEYTDGLGWHIGTDGGDWDDDEGYLADILGSLEIPIGAVVEIWDAPFGKACHYRGQKLWTELGGTEPYDEVRGYSVYPEGIGWDGNIGIPIHVRGIPDPGLFEEGVRPVGIFFLDYFQAVGMTETPFWQITSMICGE